jgi:hypothetical protein
MAKRDDRGAAAAGLLPLLAGLGLVGFGGWMWYKSQNGKKDDGTEEGDTALTVAMMDKINAMTAYHAQIYGADGTRQPDATELQTLGMMAESMQAEEEEHHWHSKTVYRDSLAHFYQDIGLFIVLPIVTGFIAVAGMVAYDRWKRPPSTRPPTSCPGCGAELPDEEVAVAHVENAHTVNPEAAQVAAATWSQQPYWVVTTTGAIGGAYNAAYQPMNSWSFNSLTQNVQGMMYAFAMGIGTSGTLAALQQTLIYCLI